MEDIIDVGVFITCEDKLSCSARIWPAENRNGSFEELNKRRHRSYISIPLWEYGFAPDEFCHEAPFLGSNGKLYQPLSTGSVEDVNGVLYEIWNGENGEQTSQEKNIGRARHKEKKFGLV